MSLEITEFKGLSPNEVAEQKKKGLLNRISKETSRTYSGIIWANIFCVYNIAVFIMAFVLLILYFYTGDKRTLYDSIAISTVAILNTIIGIIQEIRAKIALDRINALAKSESTVIREGQALNLPIDEIVSGDYILVKRGDQIPVDGKVLTARYLEIDESLLTGESDYIHKKLADTVMSGSFCVAGQGVFVATHVGKESYINRLTGQAKNYKLTLTPLQQGIDSIVKILMGIAAFMAFLVIAASIVQYKLFAEGGGEKVELLIETTRAVVSLITSMIPAGLILLSTVSFALGIFRISRKGALVQKLNAIESFANINVLCMDKTGTLTKNQLKVQKITPAGALNEEAIKSLLSAFAHLTQDKNGTILAIEKEFPFTGEAKALDEIPFSSDKKYSGLSLQINDRRSDLILGAYEKLKAHFSEADQTWIEKLLQNPDLQGFRNILLSQIPQMVTQLNNDFGNTCPLKPLGLVSLSDQVREDAIEVLEKFKAQNIKLKILSGDAPETIQHIARSVGWTDNPEGVITGEQVDRMDRPHLKAALNDYSLFARVSPKNKLDIISALKEQGCYVAMVGDGVNDVLALKEAHLGIAMGAGNRMSKDVSDIVLLNNAFSILTDVFTEGKNIIQNVAAAAKLFLTKNMMAIFLIIITGFVGLSFPFVPRHVTIFGFFAISIPAILIAFSKRQGFIPAAFLRDVIRFTLISGFVIAFSALFSYFISAVLFKQEIETGRTMILSQIVMLSLLNFLIIISEGAFIRNFGKNRYLILFAVLFLGLYLTFLFGVTRIQGLAFLANFCEITPLDIRSLLILGILTILGGGTLISLQKKYSFQPGPAPAISENLK